ncbi:MAG: hypothetical protein IKE43_04970 [Coriobacteriales bacterium]|nr:hypothetical protein [Coriobacteriales bacterium]
MAQSTRRTSGNRTNPYERSSYTNNSNNQAVGVNRKTIERRETKVPVLGIIACVATLILGILLGYFINSLFNTKTVEDPIRSVLSEAELSTVVATYKYNGQIYQITAKDAIEDASTVEAQRRTDGLYNAPTADMILSRARNEILAKLVKDNGITISQEEANQFALDTMGTSDISELASSYGISETAMQRMLVESAGAMKLYSRIAGTGNAPQEPVPPDNADTETANYAYAEYIKGLLGSLWNYETNTWADTNNEYYRALSNMVFSADSANFEAAEAAFGVAYAAYLNSNTSDTEKWINFLNQYLDNAAINIYTLHS